MFSRNPPAGNFTICSSDSSWEYPYLPISHLLALEKVIYKASIP